MKNEISVGLRNFYQELLKWIEIGCPETAVFNTKIGLCSTLKGFDISLNDEQATLLVKEYGTCGYPFNQTCAGDPCFTEDYLFGMMYRNPKRLAFIKKYAQGAK